MSALHIRPAVMTDCETLVEYNCRLALETESKELDRELIQPGVRRLLEDPSRGRYFVACDEDRVVGQLMHTWEWSDWRNGHIWWLQSVYVHADYRRRGVFRSLYEHLRQLAHDDPDVVGLRLYVERDNSRAQATYRDLGMNLPGYLVMEDLLAADGLAGP